MTDEVKNPGDNIARIKERLAEQARSVGLEMVNFSFVPGKVGGTHGLQVLFRVKEKEEKEKIDIQIVEIERGEQESKMEKKFKDRAKASEETLKDLEKRSKDPRKGLFDD